MSHKIIFTPEMLAEATRLRTEKKLSYAKIAHKLGVTEPCLRSYMKRTGFELPPLKIGRPVGSLGKKPSASKGRIYTKKIEFTPELLERIQVLRSNGYNIPSICRRLGFSMSTLFLYRQKTGFQLAPIPYAHRILNVVVVPRPRKKGTP